MAPSKNTEREVREARDRLRRYNARQAVNAHRIKRRRRDNIIAVVGLVVIAALATTAQVLYFSGGPGTPEPTASATSTPEASLNVGEVPSPDVAEARTWTGTLTINDIPLAVSLDGAAAPQAVASVITDAANGYYDGSTCHRLVNTESLKTLQCGSVDGTGAIDTTYSFGPIENAPADGLYPTGTIALANGGTAYSQDHQFFIILGDSVLPTEGGGYTVIGTVTSGLDILQSTVADAGIVDGAEDGSPVVATTISGFTVQ
ncbi:peptidyl-prolyl cis-trans isomerase B (cyclophilin B) [Glaciihabitans tibetensis]|uniref:Peptidyl-prolyl cis-trans isomerase B (Cyclophilin B) n=1 Tax=Glaciihabitans tibetensis TaxID=1266600 RepID=A0A2T0VJJ3_9MICO|nr:peptidylprolyl isomerase [Glaciihabitans tibetensis]PRY70359.1 peptidyl-prolyl cis-trans isomerase B (cyclophilin B) [Glaciihabitans tibetensis]